MSTNTVAVDLDVGFHNEDETGYLWTWLSEARDPSIITPDRIERIGSLAGSTLEDDHVHKNRQDERGDQHRLPREEHPEPGL